MWNRSLIAVVTMAAFALILGPRAQAQTAAPILLKGINEHPADHPWGQPFVTYLRELEKRSGGRIKTQYLGGVEVIPTFEQFKAMGSGTYDIGWKTYGFIGGAVPVALAMHFPVGVSAAQLREAGVFKLLDGIYREKGVTIFGDYARFCSWVWLMRRPMPKADFTGMKLRGLPSIKAMIERLGGAMVLTPMSEAYTALERGIVDGTAFPDFAVTDQGFHEVIKYVVGPPFQGCGSGMVMNAKKFDSMPPDLQKLVIDTYIEVIERDAPAKLWLPIQAQQKKQIAAKGVQFVDMNPAEAKKIRETAWEEGWKSVLARDPVNGPKLKALMDRFKP